MGANATFGADNEGIGKLSGEIMAKRAGAGPVKIGILEGAPEDKFVGPARKKGFLEGLAAGGTKSDVVARRQAKYAQDLAVPATEDMLTAHPDVDDLRVKRRRGARRLVGLAGELQDIGGRRR